MHLSAGTQGEVLAILEPHDVGCGALKSKQYLLLTWSHFSSSPHPYHPLKKEGFSAGLSVLPGSPSPILWV